MAMLGGDDPGGDDPVARALATNVNALSGWSLRGHAHPFVEPMSWYCYAEHVGHTIDLVGDYVDAGPRARLRQFVPLPEYHHSILELWQLVPPPGSAAGISPISHCSCISSISTISPMSFQLGLITVKVLTYCGVVQVFSISALQVSSL